MRRRHEKFLGCVWIDLKNVSMPNESGLVFSRDIDVPGIPTRELGTYEIGAIYNAHCAKMATIRVTFNDGASGVGRAKVGESGYVNVYQRLKAGEY